MTMFKRNRDAELWPDAALLVRFPNETIREDKYPLSRPGILRSEKFDLNFPMTRPMPVCHWPRGKEPGNQPVDTGRKV